jgi:hypothetical protein
VSHFISFRNARYPPIRENLLIMNSLHFTSALSLQFNNPMLIVARQQKKKLSRSHSISDHRLGRSSTTLYGLGNSLVALLSLIRQNRFLIGLCPADCQSHALIVSSSLWLKICTIRRFFHLLCAFLWHN